MSHRVSVKSMVSCVVFALGAVVFGGCVMSPRDQSAPLLSPLAVSGYAIEPSSTVQIKAFNYVTNSYELVGTATAAPNVSAAAGVLCSNSPPFYYYSASVTLSANNWDGHVPDQNALLQVTQVSSDGSTTPLFGTHEANPIACIGSNITRGCDFYDVAYNKCGFKVTEIRIRKIG